VLFLFSVMLPSVLPVIGQFAPLVLTPALSVGYMQAVRTAEAGRMPSPWMLYDGLRAQKGRGERPLLLLGLIIVSSTDLFHNSTKALFTISLLPLALLLVVIILPPILKRQGNSRIAKVGHAMHDAMIQVRQGLAVFKQPRIALPATFLQVGAWAIQLASCWALMFALGLDHRAGLAASAAVLFAVNVTAVVPATPSNIGIFQLAVISVLHTGWGVSTADALAYGVILQAVEIATAVGLGLPALFREGLTWSDLRSQALATSTVELNYKPRREKHSRVGDTI